MAHERSDQVYHAYLQASEKFDYFILGVEAALIGYLGAALDPAVLGWNSEAVAVAALVSFVLSFIAGLKRGEAQTEFLKVMFHRLYAEEGAGQMARIMAEGRTGVNVAAGNFVTPSEAVERRQERLAKADAAGELLDLFRGSSLVWYRTRNVFLVLGFILLVVSKLVLF